MMNAILIPAYKPDEKLLALAEKLAAHEDLKLIVVDDGSGEAYKPLFAQLPSTVTLISYPDNKGKGGALKTGIRYIFEHMTDCARIITADADGQHKYEDIQRVIEASIKEPGALVLGSRAFDGRVPLRSRFGNSMTRQAFSIATGVRLQDTQTGLRGFDRASMELFMDVPGDRYEYEINVLLIAARHKIPIRELTIQTVYLDDNQSSHFSPFKDSMRIYICLIKFAMSSLIAFGIDYLLFLLLRGAIGRVYANIIARIVSATANFFINKKVVFKGDEHTKNAIVKYALLAVAILAVNTLMLQFFTVTCGWKDWIAKPVTELALFIVNYVVQGKFVYRKHSKG